MPDGQFQTVETRRAHADAATVTEFLSRTGYQLPIAVADLIDNAIDAHASRVHLSLVLQAGRPALLVIADNGSGMDPTRMERAVSLEKDPSKQTGEALGRYGAGLKAASFSLGRVLNIVSKTDGSTAIGAVLDQDTYRSNFEYRVLDPATADAVFNTSWGGERLGRSGTVLLIGNLAAMVPSSDTSQDLFLNGFQEDLDARIGMVFHRYIESGRLKITKSKRTLGATFLEEFDHRPISPVNPFAYPTSGHPDYPRKEVVSTGHSDVPVTLHLWPKQGRTKATRHKFYDILGRSGEWQGLYFYRLDRLLQAGGWNGLRGQEPHMSYARIVVDLPIGSDDEFRPTVMKDRIENARPLLGVLMKKRYWQDYIQAAGSIYRSKPAPAVQKADAEATMRVAPRPKWTRFSRRPSVRIGDDGSLHLDKRLVTSLGDAKAEAIRELVWQATREATPKRRLSPQIKQDLEHVERAVAVLAGRTAR